MRHESTARELLPRSGARQSGRRVSPPPPGLQTTPDTTGRPVQLALDELGTPLCDVTFVVVDLETTGGSAKDCEITEIGAVKVRGGERVGEFQTLVDPGVPVPAFIARLTGISTAMLVGAPRIEDVMPSFLEFARGSVLVAHNAPFDMSFLRAAAARSDLPWPGNQVLDTVALARRVVTRDEAPNHKLSTLANLFHATVTPDHRALADARATVDVMHALFDRLAPLGITHLEDLATATDPVPADIRRKRHLADGLPVGPGVYMFVGPRGEVLYVGTSTSVHKRVRSYFTASEKRGRMIEMIRLAESVRAVPCSTELESRVRELRLITEHAPRYNRRSKHPERMHWVRLTSEAYPRLTVVRDVRQSATGPTEPHIGPFVSRGRAQEALEALQSTHAVRQCATRLPAVPAESATACALAEMRRCSAPCLPAHKRPSAALPEPYSDVVDAVRTTMRGDAGPVVTALSRRIKDLAVDERFEDAATERDRLTAYIAGATRAQRLEPLSACEQLVAARPWSGGGWEIVVVRHGRLASTAVVGPGRDPYPTITAAVDAAEHVVPRPAPQPACHPEETDLVLAWLRSEGVRLVSVTHPQTCPARGAEKYLVNTTPAGVVSGAV